MRHAPYRDEDLFQVDQDERKVMLKDASRGLNVEKGCLFYEFCLSIPLTLSTRVTLSKN